jgi:D-alanyl-D-alanine carboxypeptidase
MCVAVQAAANSAVLIVDANTGRVLHQSAADEPRHPASLAKMMTLYLAFELIEQGRLSYQTRLKISANAAETAPTKLDLDEGEEIALIDAMKALITKSANDMAVAIAEHIAGSEEKFARLMTQRARQLGMSATTFRNASGLPDDEQITTARDMITLALHLQDDFPKHYPLFSTRSFTYKGETFSNHNTLLSSYEGTDGIKTGYTRASGFNLVSSVKRGRKHVVGVIFGGASAASRNAAMRTFLNMGLVKASSEKTRQPAPLVARAPARDPRIAAVPAPRRVERAPTVEPAPSAQVPPVTASDTQASPTIRVARVRPVLFTPGTVVTQPRVRTASNETASTADEPLSRPGYPVSSAAPAPTQPWVTTAAGSPLQAASPGPARGAEPSTFEQQAAKLTRGEASVAAPSRSAPLSARAPAPEPAAGTFHIQIGAYQSQAEAERRLASAREIAPGLLAKRSPVTTQVKQGDKLFYRARYAGFEAKSAASACSELKRLKIDCLVMKAE